MNTEDTLEDRLKSKLSSGELSKEEFQELYNKFKKLGILKTKVYAKSKSKIVESGSSRIDGGRIDGPVTISGRVIVDGPLECQKLSISGYAKIDGDLTVIGKTSVSGSIEIEGNARFGDGIAVSGSLVVDRNLYSTAKFSLNGKAEIAEDFIADNRVVLSGKFNCENLRSTDVIKLMGTINIKKDVLATKLEIDSGKVSIGRDIKAKKINVYPKLREAQFNPSDDDIPGIGNLISNVMFDLVPSILNTVLGAGGSPLQICMVKGDMIGEEIDISNANITGDVLGDYIIIGPNVKIGGIIKYKNELKVPENSNYSIMKIEENRK